jgi:hypothetical protein
MLLSFSSEQTQKYLSNTHLRKPPSQNGQDGLTGGGGEGKNDCGDTEEQYKVRYGEKGYH